MKRFFTLCAVAGIVALGAMAQRPEEPMNFTSSFSLGNGTPVINLSLTVPSHFSDGETPLTSIDSVTVIRSSYDLGEFDEPVVTFKNPVIGSTQTFADADIQMGYEYYYTAKTFVGGQTSWGAYSNTFAGIKPSAPSVSAVTANQGLPPISFSIVAPTKDSQGADLTVPLTKLVILKYISYSEKPELKTFENPVAGQTYTWDYSDVEVGQSYSFRVYAECAYGKSEENSADVFVGSDAPGAPTEVKAIKDADGHVTVSWTAPAVSLKGGWFDPAKTAYKVERTDGNTRTVLADSIMATSFVDELADVTAPQITYWIITAKNEAGVGGYAQSPELVVGPPAALPFVEDVAKEGNWGSVSYDHLWTTEVSGYSSNWNAYSWDYSNSMTGVDGTEENKKGFMLYYGKYIEPGTGEWIYSPEINVGGTKHLVLSYYYSDLGKDMGLKSAYILNNDTIALKDNLTNGAPEEGKNYKWTKVIVPIGKIQDATKISLGFRCYVPEASTTVDLRGNVGLDRIVLDDYCPAENLTVDSKETNTTAAWEAATNGRISADKYLVKVNDAEPVETANTEYSFATVAGEPYTVTVTPVYGDIESLPISVSFKGGIPDGVENVELGVAAEYFTPDGLRVANPAKGTILIRRTVSTDGKVSFSKVVF